VWATSKFETCVAVVGALLAGVPVVPLNPKCGVHELAHIVADSAPACILSTTDDELPVALAGLERIDVDALDSGANTLPVEPPADAPALIIYTSGTTGPPKGVVLSRGAIASNLDALAAAWEWTIDDVLVHALPLFHAHGLVLGTLGPLRLGGTVHHVGRFSPEAVAAELAGRATIVFGVPTMYHRLADAVERDPKLAAAIAGARLLVSGSAPLPESDHERIARTTGQRIVERYGMTETLMNCSVRAAGDRRPGSVGPPLDGVEVQLVDDGGATIPDGDNQSIGEIWVRGPNLFLRYLNRPEATAEAMTADGWFRTGDVATRDPDGYLRIVGRLSTDLIKTGGFKVGAGEVENALLGHPAVAETAVTGEPDPDLGERIVAWVVLAPGQQPSEHELADHVSRLLAPHKRPRRVHYLDALPRNAMGKVTKTALTPSLLKPSQRS
jgi:malonyl-CoA/methylmalonyl-CoA synthetase